MSTPGGAPSAYVASPLGFSEPTRSWYADVLLPAIALGGMTPLDPWAVPFDDLDVALAEPDAERRVELLSVADRRIAARNAELIRSAAGVLAVLDGSDVDSGTAAEIGYAAALGVPVVGWRSDLRRTGDNAGTTVNLQVEHFVSLGVHTELPDAIAALSAALTDRRGGGRGGS